MKRPKWWPVSGKTHEAVCRERTRAVYRAVAAERDAEEAREVLARAVLPCLLEPQPEMITYEDALRDSRVVDVRIPEMRYRYVLSRPVMEQMRNKDHLLRDVLDRFCHAFSGLVRDRMSLLLAELERGT